MSKEAMQRSLATFKILNEGGGLGYENHALIRRQIETLEAELAKPEQEPTVPDNMQDWAKLDGATAWHLMERHADNWADIGKMMDEYVAAKLAKPEQEPVVWIRLIDWNLLDYEKEGYIPLYISPPRKKSVNEFNPDWDQQAVLVERIRELESELAKPEQKPVAWMLTLPDGTHDWILDGRDCDGYVPLYTSPPRKEWVGLTDDEKSEIYNELYTSFKEDNVNIVDLLIISAAVEFKLREKNT